mgnify:FL=1|tara:strand:- start:1151 stop:1474 length:324 start_codon:yes stop_codon:yes gene_type:complete
MMNLKIFWIVWSAVEVPLLLTVITMQMLQRGYMGMALLAGFCASIRLIINLIIAHIDLKFDGEDKQTYQHNNPEFYSKVEKDRIKEMKRLNEEDHIKGMLKKDISNK